MDFPPFPAAAIAAAREAAKVHLRIAGASEDALIDGLAATALALAERFTGTVLVARDFVETLAPARHWQVLGAAPVTAIEAGLDAAIDIDPRGVGRVRTAARVRVAYPRQRHPVRSVAGGATIVQNGLVAQSRFERVHLFQDDPANPVWSNAAHEYVDNQFENCLLQHVTDSMVHAFDLVAVAGLINDNVWRGCRIQNCGTRHFFNLESTSLGPQFSNKFEDLTFEVCLGGGIRIRGANFVIDNCQNWDAGIGAIVNDFYDIDRNLAGTVCAGRIRDCGRWSGTMGAGRYDVSLPGGGGGAGIEITDCRAIGSGDSFTVNARHNAIRVSGVIPNVLTITDGDGALTDNAAFGYFDSWGEYRVRGRKVLGERGAAVGDATAGTIVDTVNLLLARLRAHGLIENS